MANLLKKSDISSHSNLSGYSSLQLAAELVLRIQSEMNIKNGLYSFIIKHGLIEELQKHRTPECGHISVIEDLTTLVKNTNEK